MRQVIPKPIRLCVPWSVPQAGGEKKVLCGDQALLEPEEGVGINMAPRSAEVEGPGRVRPILEVEKGPTRLVGLYEDVSGWQAG